VVNGRELQASPRVTLAAGSPVRPYLAIRLRDDLPGSVDRIGIGDLDGDGKAEVALKTGEGDPRDPDGHVLGGPKYVSVWNGLTGAEIAPANWILRGKPSEWGDYTGNRMNRNMIGVAYLDGKTPGVVTVRYNLPGLLAGGYRLSGFDHPSAHRMPKIHPLTRPEFGILQDSDVPVVVIQVGDHEGVRFIAA